MGLTPSLPLPPFPSLLPQCRFKHITAAEQAAQQRAALLAASRARAAVSKDGTGGIALRRPFLHIIVLFGADARVTAYARNVAAMMLSRGIDVLLQTHLADTPGLPKHGAPQLLPTPGAVGVADHPTPTRAQHIKPEHLSTVIAASAADFLIVIGDRNMQNKSCQECVGMQGSTVTPVGGALRRVSNKLVEVSVNQRLISLLSTWSVKTGVARPGQQLSDKPGSAEAEARRVAKLREGDLFDVLATITGLGHVRARLSRLRGAVRELVAWKARNRAGNGALSIRCVWGGGLGVCAVV